MVFIETPIFTHLITELLDDDNYSRLQTELVINPDKGALIVGGGGIRKIRWSLGKGRGKRSGVRIIYYYKDSKGQILMLYVYPKNVADNLTAKQKKILNQIAKEFYNEP
ncbi:MAG: type II toxin-antitoxin system RelE/ParE family toxin [Spirochaetia bacterium]|nr:type II toxin-antitoxin system RelE/ParE family toxin [Spirochaetia bacterium]